jgi:hypothetical protein
MSALPLRRTGRFERREELFHRNAVGPEQMLDPDNRLLLNSCAGAQIHRIGSGQFTDLPHHETSALEHCCINARGGGEAAAFGNLERVGTYSTQEMSAKIATLRFDNGAADRQHEGTSVKADTRRTTDDFVETRTARCGASRDSERAKEDKKVFHAVSL